MTTDRAVGLIREVEGPQRTTLLELFLDLAFVAALALTSRTLAQHLDWVGALQTVVLLMAIWWVWSATALATDLYHTQRPPIFVMTLWVMLGTIPMAGSLPAAFSGHALVFAGAYVAIHVGRGIFLVAALHSHAARVHASRFIFWFVVSAVPWLAGGLVAGPARGLLWIAALVIDYGSAWLRYPTPRFGRVPTFQYSVAADHLAERYQQFFTLALGDLILVTTLTYTDNDMTADRTAALLVAFAATVLLWQIYVYRAGAMLQAAIESSRDPGRFVRSAPNTHLLMVAGVVATAAGFEVVIAHPTHRTHALAGRRHPRRSRGVRRRPSPIRIRGVQPGVTIPARSTARTRGRGTRPDARAGTGRRPCRHPGPRRDRDRGRHPLPRKAARATNAVHLAEGGGPPDQLASWADARRRCAGSRSPAPSPSVARTCSPVCGRGGRAGVGRCEGRTLDGRHLSSPMHRLREHPGRIFGTLPN